MLHRILFDAVSRCDLYDLGKLLSTLNEARVKSKLLACHSMAKREEAEHGLGIPGQVHPIEAEADRQASGRCSQRKNDQALTGPTRRLGGFSGWRGA